MLPVELKFSVNSAIIPGDRYFIVDSSKWIVDVLFVILRTSFCVMLVAPRASGKSTCIYQSLSLLKQQSVSTIPCLLNFEKGFPFESLDEKLFWTRISYELSFQTGKKLSFDDSFGFLQTFQNHPDSPFYGCEVFLFIDEFDIIALNETIRANFLSTLRGMKQARNDYTLKSVVAVGTFALLVLVDGPDTPTVRSPFNAASVVYYPFFDLHDTISLFNLFSKARNETLSPDIVQEIFALTRGHKGLTCLLGKIIDEDFRSLLKGKIPDLNDWIRLRSLISILVNNYPTMSKMVNVLRSHSPLARSARNFLSSYLLPFSYACIKPHPTHEQICTWLHAEGVLTSHNLGTFELTSPLLRQVLLTKVVPVDRRPCPSLPPPRFSLNLFLDIRNVIFLAISFFNPENIQKAYHISYKSNRGNNYKRDAPVPEEAVYHFEIFSVLSAWFPDEITILPEVNAGSERCDMLIKEGDTSYLLEFEASDPPKKIKFHADRLSNQKEVLKATQAWLIYFSPVYNFTWPTMGENCFSLAVVHDNTFSQIQMYSSETECQVVNINK